MNEALTARVKGVNKAHAYANKLYPILRKLFEPFVGQKILTQPGPLLAKVKKMVDDLHLPNDSYLSVYRHVSNYSLAYTVKTCEVTNGHGYYYEVTIYIGTLQGLVLKELEQGTVNFRTDFTVASVEAARQAYSEAKKKADEAHNALFPFGEYDH